MLTAKIDPKDILPETYDVEVEANFEDWKEDDEDGNKSTCTERPDNGKSE